MKARKNWNKGLTKHTDVRLMKISDSLSINLVDKKFGKLTVLSEDPFNNGQNKLLNCICECGNSTSVFSNNLVRGHTKSCGCSKKLKNSNHPNWRGYEEIPKSFFSGILNSAKKRNIPISISIEYVWDLYVKQNKNCALSGLYIQFSVDASLDRIDSNIGYIENNVQLVHKHINIMKNTFSQDYFISLCEKIFNNQS